VRGIVVKPDLLRPGPHRVAGLAVGGLAVRPELAHAGDKLAPMRILVALRAGKTREVVRRREVTSGRFPRLMARHARGGNVAANQREARGFVPRERKRRRAESMDGVTVFATVLAGRPRELSLMDVSVAILAGRQFNLVKRVEAGRNMALYAGRVGVFPLQRIISAGMFGHAKGGGFESIQGVARRAIASVLSRQKLAVVRVGMTVQAAVERQGQVEVSALVAGLATHRRMLPLERVLGF